MRKSLALAVVLAMFSTACFSREPKKATPPAYAIRVVHEPTTRSTVYLVPSSPGNERCFDIVVITPDGKAHKSSLGCKGDEIEPLEPVGVGYLGRDVGINYAFGKAPEGTRTVRAFDEVGKIYSDTNVTDWWLIVFGSGRMPIGFEALDGRGSVILRRDEGKRAGGTPTETPSVRIEPRSGPAGTLIKVTGDGFDKQMQSRIRLGSEQLGLYQRIENCDLIASSEVSVVVDESGHLEGQFLIPAKPKCFGEDHGGPLSPGLWAVFVGCRQCLYADFRITK